MGGGQVVVWLEQCCTRLRNSKGFMIRSKLIYAVTSGQGLASCVVSVGGGGPGAAEGDRGEVGECWGSPAGGDVRGRGVGCSVSGLCGL